MDSTRVQKVSVYCFSNNLHILTLESGTVEINLAIKNACIDFCVSCLYFKSHRVHRKSYIHTCNKYIHVSTCWITRV